ncbi:ATP-binding protein [Nonomuraea sp. NN258]|uniref:type IV secretory system conjugative DNA transfer family protein n=1 Tax=Nonomuraea antri TaxID=2730852 RepID=UPI00156853A2|nr:type IV secretion system DNA-binding domain-containing protein [Nonomuraea antri]NRQ30653.1 ATP-binding protein [Nonomuraea antri]
MIGAFFVLVAVRAVLWRWRNARFARNARLVEIAIPPQVESGSAAAWWSQVMGLTAPRWKRCLLGQPHLAWEYVADASGVRVQLWVPGLVPPGLVEKAIRSAWPGAAVTTRPAEPPARRGATTSRGRMVLARADHYPLATTHGNDPLRALLGALSGLRPGERAAVQVLVRPVTGRRLSAAYRAASVLRNGTSGSVRSELFDLITPGSLSRARPSELARMFPERAEEIRAILAKASQSRFAVQISYAVTSDRPDARGRLRGRAHEIAATFALYASGHQYLRRLRGLDLPGRMANRRMNIGYLLSVSELAAIAHLPYDQAAPGIARAGARPVPPAPDVPTHGQDVRVLGDAETGHPRPVGVTVAASRQHLHVLGQTGVGKSTFLANLILSDARASRGALVIDPKGDLIDDVLDRLPERAIERTVLFDPAEPGNPPCFNILAGPDPAFAVDSIVTIFHRCFASSWGPRLDDLMRSACLTLVRTQHHRATLADVPKLLTDTPFRARIVGQLNDELLRGFWSAYDELSPAARASVISPVMNKLRAVLLRPFVRDALSGGPSTFDLARTLDTGGLVLARLPKGVLGEDAARLFGSLLLAHTWQAITPRVRLAEDERRDAAAYIDEAHNFLNMPISVSDLLAEARAYRFSLTLAHQHLSQLPRDLREAVSADARNKIYFTSSPEDAHDLARHVGPVLNAHDLSHLGAYQAVGRIITGQGGPSSAFTLRTRPLPDPIPGRQEAVRAASRAAYARPEVRTTSKPKLRIPTDPRRTSEESI